eukprot:2285954-Pleurochrysis_carterae.AAC.1
MERWSVGRSVAAPTAVSAVFLRLARAVSSPQAVRSASMVEAAAARRSRSRPCATERSSGNSWRGTKTGVDGGEGVRRVRAQAGVKGERIGVGIGAMGSKGMADKGLLECVVRVCSRLRRGFDDQPDGPRSPRFQRLMARVMAKPNKAKTKMANGRKPALLERRERDGR